MKKTFLVPLFLTIITILLVVYEIVSYRDWQTSFLILNLFLAWIPFLLSLLIFFLYNSRIKPIIKHFFMILCGVVWFLFYPNIPYLLTDMIHIQTNDYMVLRNHVFVYNFDFLPWFELAQFILTVFIGIIIGFLSLYMIHRIFADRSRIASWIFVIFISITCGFGVYVGRFLRLNSWEILKIFATFKDLNLFEIIEFSFLFGAVWFLIYLSLYEIVKNRQNCK